MRRVTLCILIAAATIPVSGQNAPRLVYADFQQMDGGRPVSARGGQIQLTSYQENAMRPPRFTSLPDRTPPAPELVRLKADDPNHAAAFDYELQVPNQFAGVGIEVAGHADNRFDDVSGYKYVQLDVYATGVSSLRIELVSRGHDVNIPLGYPQAVFKLKEGLNTYRIKLDSLRQPSWAQKVNPKEVLQKLTSLSIVAFCEQCTATKGTVVVDNISFEN